MGKKIVEQFLSNCSQLNVEVNAWVAFEDGAINILAAVEAYKYLASKIPDLTQAGSQTKGVDKIVIFHGDKKITIPVRNYRTSVPEWEKKALQYFVKHSRCSDLLIWCNTPYREINPHTHQAGLVIECSNVSIAHKLWERRHFLRNALIQTNWARYVLLKIDHQLFKTITTMESMNLNFQDIHPRAIKHRQLLKAIAHNVVAVTLHTNDDGFIYLDVCVDIPERLNKPKQLLLGNPASVVDPQIAEPRIYHIKKALENAQCETYSYSYEDLLNDCLWEFNVSVTPIYGSEEVITIIQDAHAWQRPYWDKKLSRVKK